MKQNQKKALQTQKSTLRNIKQEDFTCILSFEFLAILWSWIVMFWRGFIRDKYLLHVYKAIQHYNFV